MKSTTKKIFEYSAEDIEKLIKEDVERKLNSNDTPVFDKVRFNVTMEDDPTDWRAEFAQTPVLKGARLEVEI